MHSESQTNAENDGILEKAARTIASSENTVALTGAGISVASGIPPFRGEGGLWSKYNPDDFAHVEAFKRNPDKVWIMLKEMIDTIEVAKPNAAHHALAELEKIGFLQGIITGNVDYLHQAAGNINVLELHGNNRSLICMKCRNNYPVELYQKEMPPRCECGYPLRPEVVLFGEQLPQKTLMDSYSLAQECDLMIVVGTSQVVTPMSHMPFYAKENGASVLEINLEETHLTNIISDWMIKGRAEKILPEIVNHVRKL
jgi:NAD-dependent deacetylase